MSYYMDQFSAVVKHIMEVRFKEPASIDQTIAGKLQQLLSAANSPGSSLTGFCSYAGDDNNASDCITYLGTPLVTHTFIRRSERVITYEGWEVNFPVEVKSWEYLAAVVLELIWVKTPVSLTSLTRLTHAVGAIVEDVGMHGDGTVGIATISMSYGGDSYTFEFPDSGVNVWYANSDFSIEYDPCGCFPIAKVGHVLKQAWAQCDGQDNKDQLILAMRTLHYKTGVNLMLTDTDSGKYYGPLGDSPVVLRYKVTEGKVKYTGWSPLVLSVMLESQHSQRDRLLITLRMKRIPYSPWELEYYLYRHYGMLRLTDGARFLERQSPVVEIDRVVIDGVEVVAAIDLPEPNTLFGDDTLGNIVYFPNMFTEYSALYYPDFELVDLNIVVEDE